MVDDKVVSFIKDNGPSLPVEIGKSIGYNSFITKAILLELINKELIRKSKRAIGGSLLYYVKGQGDLMRKRLYEDLGIPEKKVLDKIKEEGEVMISDLTPHERAFIKGLIDFISIEKKDDDYLITHCSYDGSSKPEVKPVKVPQKKKEEGEEDKDFKLFDKKKPKGFDSRARSFLEKMGEVLSAKKVRSGSEYDYLLRVKEPYPHELFVKAKKKKHVTSRDLGLVYTKALKLKKPALVVTTGKLSKRAQKWKKENVGELVKVVQIE
ncbi:hypothetical protein GF352_03795 [archaeon]|nr:hypothetical protein [archaeon]